MPCPLGIRTLLMNTPLSCWKRTPQGGVPRIPESQFMAGAGAPVQPSRGGLQNVYHQLNHITVLIECTPGCHNHALCLIDWKIMITCSSHQAGVGTSDFIHPWAHLHPSSHHPLLPGESIAWGTQSHIIAFEEGVNCVLPLLHPELKIRPGQDLHLFSWGSPPVLMRIPSVSLHLTSNCRVSLFVAPFYTHACTTHMFIFCDFIGMICGREG